MKPVPVGTVEVRTKLAHAPEKVQDFVSDMGNFDKYAPGLSGTKLDPHSETHGHYQTTMKYMGTVCKANLDYQKTSDGVDFAGHWDLKNIRNFPPIKQTASLKVQPAEDGGSVLSFREDYQLPAVLMPAFPVLRLCLRHLIRDEHKTLDQLLSKPDPEQPILLK